MQLPLAAALPVLLAGFLIWPHSSLSSGCLFAFGSPRLLNGFLDARMTKMETLDALSAVWPIAFGFVTLVIVLAKMHSDIEQIKEKVRTLFELFNNRNK
mgnify:CR=1 FL=1